jgi:hypothetical protein
MDALEYAPPHESAAAVTAIEINRLIIGSSGRAPTARAIGARVFR